MKFWNLIEAAVISQLVAIGVAATVGVYDIVNHRPGVLDMLLCYLLTVSITCYTYALFGMRRLAPPPPEPKPEPRRIPELYPMPILTRKPRNFDSDASGLDGEWAVIGLDHYKLLVLKDHLSKTQYFSYRTMPYGTKDFEYQRIRTFLLSRKWGELHRGAVKLTPAGLAALSPIEPAK